jgi:hypothetical protein
VILHPAFVQELIVHKQVPSIDGSAIIREGGTNNRERLAQRIQESVGDRSNISLRCGIEG